MLFSEKKSALVRLSDCIKLGIGNCLDTTNDLIELHSKYEEPLRITRAIAKDILEDRILAEEGEKKILEVHKNIPDEDARKAVSLQGRLHSECLSVLLNCCFALYGECMMPMGLIVIFLPIEFSKTVFRSHLF